MILNTTNNQNKKMNLLYYPYINLPDTEWTIRTLLYYDNVSSIVRPNTFMNRSDMNHS